jgi:hypothetical protein
VAATTTSKAVPGRCRRCNLRFNSFSGLSERRRMVRFGPRSHTSPKQKGPGQGLFRRCSSNEMTKKQILPSTIKKNDHVYAVSVQYTVRARTFDLLFLPPSCSLSCLALQGSCWVWGICKHPRRNWKDGWFHPQLQISPSDK